MDEEFKSVKDFQKWYKDNLNVSLTSADENHYYGASKEILDTFSTSPFWTDLLNHFSSFNQDYYFATNYYLFSSEYKPQLVVKPFKSILEKCFRKNKLYNRNFPEPPRTGWITPDNWFESINDIVRTTIVVRYLDGVEFILERICELAEKHGLEQRSFKEARDEGYYAVHIYLKSEFEIPSKTWTTERKGVQIEIQISTELQDNIKRLTHKYYEGRRMKASDSKEKWQWDYRSAEFSVNYLGHILHYIEGMIMEVRNKK